MPVVVALGGHCYVLSCRYSDGMDLVSVHRHEPSPITGATVSVTVAPHGHRTWPIMFSLTADEYSSVVDAMIAPCDSEGD